MLWGQHVGGLGEKTVIFAGVMTYVLGRQGDKRWSRGAAVLIGARSWTSGVSQSVTGALSWRMFVSWWYCFYVLFSVHLKFFSKKFGGTEIVYLLKPVNPFTRWITLYRYLWVFSSPRNLCLHVHNHQVQTSKRLTLTRELRDPAHRHGAHLHFSGASSIQPQLPLQQSMLTELPSSQCVTVLWTTPVSYYSNHKNIS